MTTINRVRNSNVLIRGESLLGKAAQVDLPSVVCKREKHRALGFESDYFIHGGFEKMQATFHWNSFYPEVLALVNNPFQSVDLQVRSNVESYDHTGLVKEQTVVIFLQGAFVNLELGNLVQGGLDDSHTVMEVLYFKLEIDKKQVLELDVFSGLYRANGIEISSQKNLI